MMSNKYDMHIINPMYQLDFSAVSKGKHFAGSKRHVQFKFGISNPDALRRGLQGIHCRGEEHEVTFVWSTSKRVVTMDTKQVVHNSVVAKKKDNKHFECSWPMKSHILKLVANASGFYNPSGGRQFDLFLDGMSFFDLPKIYELGVVVMDANGGGGLQPEQTHHHEASSFASSPPPNNVQSPRYDYYAYEDSYSNTNDHSTNNNDRNSYSTSGRAYHGGDAGERYSFPTVNPTRGGSNTYGRSQSTVYCDAASGREEEPRRTKSMPALQIRRGAY